MHYFKCKSGIQKLCIIFKTADSDNVREKEQSRLRWEGHLMGLLKMRHADKVLVGRLKETDHLGDLLHM